jgi:putative endonuclease
MIGEKLLGYSTSLESAAAIIIRMAMINREVFCFFISSLLAKIGIFAPIGFGSLNLIMADHNDTGKTGEALAIEYLEKDGYNLLEKNWRHGKCEVDVIAWKKEVLHFIEVKTRKDQEFGLPEEKVNKKKISNLMKAASEYLYLHPEWKQIQLDILSIKILPGEPIEYFFIEDIYL